MSVWEFRQWFEDQFPVWSLLMPFVLILGWGLIRWLFSIGDSGPDPERDD